MTTLYMPIGSGSCELCHPIDSADFDLFVELLNGTPRQPCWVPIQVRLIRNNCGRRLIRSDAPWLGSDALIFRDSVVEALGPILRQHGELLPLKCRGTNLSVFHPTVVLDALDEGASTLRRFSSGRIMMIDSYVFRSEVVAGIDLFKLASLRSSPTFVSQRFVAGWNAAGLHGLDFHPVWNSG